MPAANKHYWHAKLERNVARDRRNAEALHAAGWQLLVVWEHENVADAGGRIEALVRSVAKRE